jgi:hypothetical protein
MMILLPGARGARWGDRPPQGLRTGCFREEKNMKRLPLMSVLLVVLTLLCASATEQSAAWAGEPDGALRAPDATKNYGDQILDPTGSPDDDADGDPDTAGDGFGFVAEKNPLGGSQQIQGPVDRLPAVLVLLLVNYVVILR